MQEEAALIDQQKREEAKKLWRLPRMANRKWQIAKPTARRTVAP